MAVRQWWVRRRVLALLSVLILVGVRAPAEENLEAARIRTSEERMRKDITFLASDECEGRGPTTKGINLAADYIANEFKKAGLKPGGKDDTYFQPFAILGAKLEGRPRLALQGPAGQQIELAAGRHFQPLGLSHSGTVKEAVVFAGYGITSPKDPDYDDYKDLDVEDKVVVVLRDAPRATNKYAVNPGWKLKYGSVQEKLKNAFNRKASAVIFVNDWDTARTGDDLLDFNYWAAGSSPVKLPVFHLRRSVLEAMLQSGAGADLADVEKDIDRELKPRSAALDGWTAQLEVKVARSGSMVPLKNIVGVLEGKGKLAKETVVIGAHYDHVGYGGQSSMAVLRDGLKKMAIHHGADDNGSGSTAVIELARRFANKPDREGRRLVFMTFSGEEMGLLGSKHYCKDPLFPLVDTAAMINLDMVGRLSRDPKTNKDKLQVWGTGTAKTFNHLIDDFNKKYDFQLRKIATGGGPSDHASFYDKKVPVFFFFTGDHPDYHRPSDTAEKINVTGMRRVTDLAEELIAHLATVAERPEYVKVAGGTGFGPGQVPRIGIRPSYGDDQDGVFLEGVVDGGPAAKAGLKEGDLIVEIAGKPVKNMEAYMTVMRAQKKGEPIDMGVLRDGKKLFFQVKPE